VKVLAGRLFDSARQFVESALTAYDRSDTHVFLLHGGTALEHMLKARLAEANPALLAKRDHFPSLVWFADETKHSAVASVELRTVTLEDAMGLATAWGVPISLYRESLTLLQRHRNGVAHLGISDDKVAFEVLPGLLRTLILLSQELGQDPATLFGSFNSFVISQLDEQQAEEQRIWDGRFAQAQMRFHGEHPNLTAEEAKALRDLVEMRWRRMTLDDQLADCPVCVLPAYLSGTLDQVGWDVDFDKEGNPEGAYPSLEYTAYDLRCPTCGLVLDTPGLISVSGALENWQLPEDDFDAWIREFHEQDLEAWDRYR
jgi:hypothetical protein